MEAIVAQSLTVVYPTGTKALDGVSFIVPQGTILGYLGPNGAGKTTTVNVLSTAMPPTDGEAWVCGFNIRTHKEQIRKRIGVATQDVIVDPFVSPYENMRLFAILFGIPRHQRERRIQKLLEDFDLASKARDMVFTLSGGQRKRLQLAVALLRCPEVLFLDEPTLGLDPLGKRTLFRYLRDLADSGTTIFYSSNEMEQLEQVCDRVLFLFKGRVIAEGSMTEFIRKFGGGDLVILHYEGTIPEHFLSDLERRDDLQIQSISPLSLISPDVHKLLPPLIAALSEQGVIIHGIEIRKPTLNDAFLKLVEEMHLGED